MRTLMLASLLAVGCSGGEATKPEPKAEPKEEPKPEPKEEPKPEPAPDFGAMSEDEQHTFLMEKGKEVYLNSSLACKTCHQEDGKGQEGVFPPLVGQKDHMGDCVKHAAIVIYGLQGEMVVDGKTYNGAMTPQGSMLNDLEIAAVISYERHSWGNDFGYCSPDDVKKARESNPL
ncbi:MAG: cytochrome c [Alphaproteobacteria bacterium]|nr:cytochrome c [Alphaproteobacteria bacterium]